jgi:hypothetical protein
MGEWRISEDRLATYGASTCIVLAAHNSETGKGLLGHFSSISERESGNFRHGEEFRQSIDALSQLGEHQHNSIWLGAGKPLIVDGIDTVMPDRKLAQRAILGYLDEHGTPIEQVKVVWSAPQRVMDVELNCLTGRLDVYDYPEITLSSLLGALKEALSRDDLSAG